MVLFDIVGFLGGLGASLTSLVAAPAAFLGLEGPTSIIDVIILAALVGSLLFA
jgi:hypothetical protein